MLRRATHRAFLALYIVLPASFIYRSITYFDTSRIRDEIAMMIYCIWLGLFCNIHAIYRGTHSRRFSIRRAVISPLESALLCLLSAIITNAAHSRYVVLVVE